MKMGRLAIAAAMVLAMVLVGMQQSAGAQEKRVSPHEKVQFAFANGKKVTIEYGRPYVKDPRSGKTRKIFGNVVPYGEPWRVGADEATSFVTESDLSIGGTSVPAGSYTLFAIPQEDGNWTLIVSKDTGEWGIPYPGQEDDFARIKGMKAAKTSTLVPQFTISMEKKGPKAAALKMAWENTEASIPVEQK